MGVVCIERGALPVVTAAQVVAKFVSVDKVVQAVAAHYRVAKAVGDRVGAVVYEPARRV